MIDPMTTIEVTLSEKARIRAGILPAAHSFTFELWKVWKYLSTGTMDFDTWAFFPDVLKGYEFPNIEPDDVVQAWWESRHKEIDFYQKFDITLESPGELKVTDGE